MEFGMMWFDNSPKTPLANKIVQASGYYRKKYGNNPNVCFVNPSMLVEPVDDLENITIRPLNSILRWHFWIGRVDKDAG